MTDTAAGIRLPSRSDQVMVDESGVPLKVQLARATRHRRINAFMLVLPLLAFIVVMFLLPIIDMMWRSVDDPLISESLPRTLTELERWDGTDVPDEQTFQVFVEELVELRKNRTIGRVATRLNYETGGMRSLMTKSGRRAGKITEAPFKDALIKADRKWGETKYWATIKRLGAPLSAVHYLAAVDARIDEEGRLAWQPEDRQIHLLLFNRTLWMSFIVTFSCFLLGYPIAYLLATVPVRISNLLLILVLLPFWTSLLVRTTSWIVLLQTNGVLNDLLVWVGIITDNQRIQMMFNATGTVVAMTQILLPFMVLPLFSVMKTISPSHMRAAQSLGATPFEAFLKVYFPQTVPGVGAGSLLVFILAIGYYITPALVGGQSGQMISNFIAFHMQKSLNWGLAAALGGILLGGVIVLYILYNRLIGIDKMKLG